MPPLRLDAAEQRASILLAKIEYWMTCYQLRSLYSSCGSSAIGALPTELSQRPPADWPGSVGRSLTGSSWFGECPFYFNFRSLSMRVHSPSSYDLQQ